MPEVLPYRRPTSVGEAQNAPIANLFAVCGLLSTSIAATEVVAWMTHRLGQPMFSGFNAPYGWISWLWTATNADAYFIPHQHVRTLTQFGMHVVWSLGTTIALGSVMTIIGYIMLNRKFAPSSARDVTQIVDSARMATIEDYRRVGFLASE
jgi:hypothetical protein